MEEHVGILDDAAGLNESAAERERARNAQLASKQDELDRCVTEVVAEFLDAAAQTNLPFNSHDPAKGSYWTLRSSLGYSDGFEAPAVVRLAPSGDWEWISSPRADLWGPNRPTELRNGYVRHLAQMMQHQARFDEIRAAQLDYVRFLDVWSAWFGQLARENGIRPWGVIPKAQPLPEKWRFGDRYSPTLFVRPDGIWEPAGVENLAFDSMLRVENLKENRRKEFWDAIRGLNVDRLKLAGPE
ncbi:hypothetical protein ACGGZK_10960 [Agromyces sp. MMS24-K17]|uniref:hypothetical protein n=1 Tax=Agromyces sp. MMS24-K17 TaxID=3372850 RepID=UPI00375421BC